MPGASNIIHVNGIDINVVESGSGFTTLIFLHYWGGSSATWEDTIGELARTHRCIAVDLRGWGASSKGDIDYSLDAMADDVVALINKLDLRDYILVGHSMGGKIAQIVATRQPDGLKGLALVAPAPPTPLPTPQEMRDQMLAALETREGTHAVIPMLAAKPFGEKSLQTFVESSLVGDSRARRAWCETGMDYDLTGDVGKVIVPIRIIVGTKDGIEPEASLRASFDKFYPGTDYAVLEGVGHMSPLEAPAELAEAIRHAAFA